MRFIVPLILGASALGVLAASAPEAPAQGRPVYNADYRAPDTYVYSSSGTQLYVPHRSTYTPTTNLYFAPSYSLPSMSYGGGFSPPATSYSPFLPSTAYSDYSVAMFSQNPAQTARVNMNDNWFQPARLIVRPGTTVRWVNYGLDRHTATSDDGLWDSNDLGPGGSYTATFHRQGSYPYKCRFHNREMQGVVVVE